MRTILDLFLHLDSHLANVIARYGAGTYGLLFTVLFCETGLVVTPFLPGDSLLFAAGAFAAAGSLGILPLLGLCWLAAVLGDTANYWVGRRAGAGIVSRGRLLGIPFKKEHIDRTHRFFDKYGAKTVVFARFMPIVRTFAPFVAGLGGMHYPKFFLYNVVGGALWVSLFLLGGYFFGNLPSVRHNFTLVILAIIVISVLPAVIEFLRSRRGRASDAAKK